MIANLAFLSAHYFGPASSRCAPATTTRWCRRTDCSTRRTAGRDRAVERPGVLQAAGRARALAPARSPDFRTNADRFQRRDEINALVNAEIGKQTIDHWVDVLNAAGVPCGA
jgi:crotonobetainyl-CoA:carnitine CoA-transferase CaiB-like acyl-CoA transferase